MSYIFFSGKQRCIITIESITQTYIDFIYFLSLYIIVRYLNKNEINSHAVDCKDMDDVVAFSRYCFSDNTVF